MNIVGREQYILGAIIANIVKFTTIMHLPLGKKYKISWLNE